MKTERLTIVVVDDDPHFRDMVEMFLSEDGHRVIHWPSAAGAAAKIRAVQPDIILLDLRLERRDSGRTLLEALQRDLVTAHVPVIAVSADTELLAQESAFLARACSGVLAKPFDLDDLQRLVQESITTQHALARDNNAVRTTGHSPSV